MVDREAEGLAMKTLFNILAIALYNLVSLAECYEKSPLLRTDLTYPNTLSKLLNDVSNRILKHLSYSCFQFVFIELIVIPIL